MFRLGRISQDGLVQLATSAEKLAPTYDAVGATLTNALPGGFRHDRREIYLPDGPDAFRRGVDGLRAWVPHTSAGLSVAPADTPALGATVALGAPVGPVTAVAVCRIVAIVDEPDRYGFAYGTLPGHPECGEELFLLERRGGRSLFKIVAFSRPREALARAAGPITRLLQTRTTNRYLHGLVNFVALPRP